MGQIVYFTSTDLLLICQDDSVFLSFSTFRVKDEGKKSVFPDKEMLCSRDKSPCHQNCYAAGVQYQQVLALILAMAIGQC